MEGIILISIVGAAAGLHSACWGAYKDSPYEPFKRSKFLRSIAVGIASSLMASFILKLEGITMLNLGVMFAISVISERALTELIKGYFREESQDKYRIPSKAHVLGKVIKNKSTRMTAGLLWTFAFMIFTLFIFSIKPGVVLKNQVAGMLFGFIGGMLIAVGGGLKDAPIEGFDRIKFLRSPLVGLLGGCALSYFSESYGVLMIASMGIERMVTEAYKTYVNKSVPGKFKAKVPAYKDWTSKRRIFTAPYLLTWILFIGLFSSNIII